MSLLTTENYSGGFLVDEELMAGITAAAAVAGTPAAEPPGQFTAFVLRHTTGEYLGFQNCETLEEALELLNRIPRAWTFESTRGCDGGKCAEGKCKGGGCRAFDPHASAVRNHRLTQP
jgi:hypothetical protein